MYYGLVIVILLMFLRPWIVLYLQYKLQMLIDSFDVWLNELFYIILVTVTESLCLVFGLKKVNENTFLIANLYIMEINREKSGSSCLDSQWTPHHILFKALLIA